MSATPLPDSALAPETIVRRVGGMLKLAARVLLGLFVLWQLIFLPVYNLLDIEESAREVLKDSRAAYKEESDKESGKLWRTVAITPGIEEALSEWLAIDPNDKTVIDKGKIGNFLKRPRTVIQWWAKRTGQEQGWCLFAPDTGAWVCFISVELRWDAPRAWPGPAGAGQPSPVELPADNFPGDIHRFVRFGYFRHRRVENRFDLNLTRHKKFLFLPPGNWEERATTADSALGALGSVSPVAVAGVLGTSTPLLPILAVREDREDWEERIARKLRNERREFLAYLGWRLARFQREHPDLPTPTQVVLHAHTWTIPRQDTDPWDWVPQVEIPYLRWLPGEEDDGEPVLQPYLPTQHRFKGAFDYPPAPAENDLLPLLRMNPVP